MPALLGAAFLQRLEDAGSLPSVPVWMSSPSKRASGLLPQKHLRVVCEHNVTPASWETCALLSFKLRSAASLPGAMLVLILPFPSLPIWELEQSRARLCRSQGDCLLYPVC